VSHGGSASAFSSVEFAFQSLDTMADVPQIDLKLFFVLPGLNGRFGR